MTALTADRKTNRREGVGFEPPVKAATKIYAGSIVCVDANGYAVPGADTAGLKVLGIAEEFVDNSAGASGDKNVKVRRGVYEMESTSLTIADVGKPMFVSDDQTVVKTATTNDVHAGILVEINGAAKAWIRIGERAGAAQADSVAADLAAMIVDFNALLAVLRANQIIAT